MEQNQQTTQTPEKPERKGSKIDNTEWGLAIGALLLIDIFQAVLDWMIIGLFVNSFIDIFVGMCWAFYLYIRGVKMDTKKGGAFIITLLLETFGIGLDSAPLWFIDGLITMSLDKADKKLPKLPI
jgi:hypothetical protein